MFAMGGWPLVGRAEEMAVVADALGHDADHAGVVIFGRAGVGKTRLAHEAALAASQRGWVVRSAAGTTAAQTIPLGAFAEWTDGAGGQSLNMVGHVIAAVTDSRDGAPVLVAVDDAHLLDELSAFVLHQLVRRRAAVVIATVRTGESAPETVNALWKDAQLRRLDLQELSRAQNDALLETALGGPVDTDSAQRMWELTRGNVLFLHELCRQELQAERLSERDGNWRWTGELTVSPTLVGLVELAIGGAPGRALDVLDLVAVAEPLELETLTAMVDPEAIEDAERNELIAVSAVPRVVRVRHPLYGEVRRAQTGLIRAARLRGRIATAMKAAARNSESPDPARLALLWLDSDLPGDADVYLGGAVTAFQRLDLSLTHRLSAAAVAAGAGIEGRLLHAQSLTRLGRADDAEQALDLFPVQQTPEVFWSVTMMRAVVMLFARGMPEKSWTVIEDAVSAAPAAAIPPLLAFRVVQLALAAQPAAAVLLAETIDRDALPVLPATILASGLNIALGDLGHAKAMAEAAEEGNRLAAASPQATYQALGLNLMHANALVLAGFIPDVRDLGEQVSRRWADIPAIPHAVATAITGFAALAHGDIPTACERLRAAIADYERQDNSGLADLLWISYTTAMARSGRVKEALDAQSRMQENRHPSYDVNEPARLHAAAWVAAARGRITEAIALVNKGADFARVHGQPVREVMCLQAALHFGESQHQSRLAELADIVEGPRAAHVARWAGALAAQDGDALLEISGDLEKMGDRIAAADAAAQAALAFGQNSRRGSRLTAAARATQIIDDCGATTPATRAAATPLPLSRREREIATLAGDGLSNREIADALTMSVRTVEGHIYRACSKLGIAGRIELGSLLRCPPFPDVENSGSRLRRA